MRITILTFSPSGNTRNVSLKMKDELTARGFGCQLIDFTGDSRCFLQNEWRSALEQEVEPHDVLIIAGPVYAHHLHYNVKTLIRALPEPNGKWGGIGIPLVTYGSISSGIALKEAGKLLNDSGRTVIAGMKVAASHKMTRAFMDQEFNANISELPMLEAVKVLVDRIEGLQNVKMPVNVTKAFSYNGFGALIMANLIFKEEKWQRERYPKVYVNPNVCTGCGVCAKFCPVLHLQRNSDGKMEATRGECIHCLNCITICNRKAIYLSGDIEKGRKFMTHMIKCHANREKPATAVYPLQD